MHKPYCCEMFKALVGDMGKRGLSIVLKSELGITFFSLQSRGIDHADRDKLRTEAGRVPGKLNLLTEIGLQYCPACGTKLAKWIRKHSKEVDELIAQSKPFYETWEEMARQQRDKETT